MQQFEGQLVSLEVSVTTLLFGVIIVLFLLFKLVVHALLFIIH